MDPYLENAARQMEQYLEHEKVKNAVQSARTIDIEIRATEKRPQLAWCGSIFTLVVACIIQTAIFEKADFLGVAMYLIGYVASMGAMSIIGYEWIRDRKSAARMQAQIANVFKRRGRSSTMHLDID